MILHAGLVARRQDGYWRGVLIEGASGAGKSDLALRALDHGFRLVADDRVVVWASGGALYGRAPDSLAYLGEALIQLKKPADACKVYAELEQVYGSTLSSGLRGMMDKGRTKAKCSV